MRGFEHKTVFITGAAKGIGASMARRFHAMGADLVLTDKDFAALNSLCVSLGDRPLALKLDVTQQKDWSIAREATFDRFSQLDVLINNAGIGPDGHLLADTPTDMYADIMRVNVDGVFLGIRTFASDFRAQNSGCIVNVASMAGHLAYPQMGAYTASKYAVVGLTEVLAAEMEPYGVDVTVFCPGVVDTQLTDTAIQRGGIPIPFLTLQEALPPERAVDALVEAIVRRRLYAFSHTDFQLHVQARMESILNAFSPKDDY